MGTNRQAIRAQEQREPPRRLGFDLLKALTLVIESVIIPVTSGLNMATGTWNSFKLRTPKEDAGGVRTEDLQWICPLHLCWSPVSLSALTCKVQRGLYIMFARIAGGLV